MKKSMFVVGVVAAAFSLVAMTSCEQKLGDDGERLETFYNEFTTYDEFGELLGSFSNESVLDIKNITAEKGLTLSFSIPQDLTDDDQYVLFTDVSHKFGLTNGYLWPWESEYSDGVGINDDSLGGTGIIKANCIADSLYTITFSPSGEIYFYINGKLIGNGWTEAAGTGVKKFCTSMLGAAEDGNLLLMPSKVTTGSRAEVSAMNDVLYTVFLSKGGVATMYKCWKTKK